MAAASLGIEDKFGRRVGIACGAQRPLPVIEIEFRRNGTQVHIGIEIGVDSSNVAPVDGSARGIAGNAIGLIIVGEHVGTADQTRQNVAAEIVGAVVVLCVGAQFLKQQLGAEKVVPHGRVY